MKTYTVSSHRNSWFYLLQLAVFCADRTNKSQKITSLEIISQRISVQVLQAS